jgi:hypothetical protein
VTIPVGVNRTANPGPLVIDVQVNACDATNCWPTGHILFEVK